jgi:hypothetical protein
VYLFPLQSLLLNLAKLCKANFAHKKCRRAYFAGLLCEVTLHGRNVAEMLCSACFVYNSIGRLKGSTLRGLLCPL